jgi:hypothetical protein
MPREEGIPEIGVATKSKRVVSTIVMEVRALKRMVLVLAAAFLPALAAGPAHSFTMSQRCVIANEDVFVMRVAAGGMSAEQRLDRVNERLAYILGYESLRPGNIRLARAGDSVRIMVGRSLLTTVTPADARANGTRDVLGLARVWQRNLRDALPEARPMSLVAQRPDATRVASNR